VRQQRAARHRTGDHVGGREQFRGDDLEQILGELPDGRWIPEQLVRVEVHAPVVAVPVIEVPVDHEHLEILELLERLLAHLVTP
jgi:hypothetical protein